MKSRRNLTDEQRTYLLGKMYEAKKHNHGGWRGNQHQNLAFLQFGELPDKQSNRGDESVQSDDNTAKRHDTSKEIASELNIGRMSVQRAGDFAEGVDAIREVSPEAADKILSGKAKGADRLARPLCLFIAGVFHRPPS